MNRPLPNDPEAGDPHASPRVWMDVTTSLRSAGVHANGTLRVERALAAALRAEWGERLGFCAYRSTERRFVAVDFDAGREADGHAGAGKAVTFGATRRDTLGKRLERTMRLGIRSAIRKARNRIGNPDAAMLFREAKPGDVLLLGGESWNERYDFDVMSRLRRTRGLRIAALCQDLIPINHPQFFESEAFIARHRAYIDWLLSDVDLVIVHSRAVQADLVAQAARRNVRPNIAIVPLGADIARAVPRPPLAEPALQTDGFVIAVSTIQSRKNFDLLYRVWQRFSDEGRTDIPRLVIVGARGFGSGDLLAQIARDPRVRESVLVLHNAGDAELAWLYRNCRFTLYPSFAEGWGLPIGESLACGKPCLASDATSMPEAGAGLAVHLDPLDFKSWHDTIVAWCDNPAACAEMAQRISATYRPITWAETARVLTDRLCALVA